MLSTKLKLALFYKGLSRVVIENSLILQGIFDLTDGENVV
jgi:hypothetical protein